MKEEQRRFLINKYIVKNEINRQNLEKQNEYLNNTLSSYKLKGEEHRKKIKNQLNTIAQIKRKIQKMNKKLEELIGFSAKNSHA